MSVYLQSGNPKATALCVLAMYVKIIVFLAKTSAPIVIKAVKEYVILI